ncbi:MULTISPECIES: ribulokinase [Flavobacteriaceae]|uniref:ribulokinase n=1 Tax=Flavobacteriaceae TaxID=49546 RepID=UPI00149272B2|nr:MULTISPECIES: ribulokinase [Allomuricauda]MDC6366248.1 ribulokinase [Muricauda sp. AC10]
MKFTLGLDFGTGSGRACILSMDSGEIVATGTCAYEGGESGTYVDPNNPLLARQSPLEYLRALEMAVKNAMQEFLLKGYYPKNIMGIGVDATGSTPIPVQKNMQPLMALTEFKDDLNAYAWLWKDHTSVNEALEITRRASVSRPEYLAKCGGTYSSEWFWSKIWHCLNEAPRVFEAAYSWVEHSDFIPAMLAGISNVKDLKRNVCAAGHKAMYSKSWGGLPDKEFLASLHPKLAELRDRLYDDAYNFEESLGTLSLEWSKRLGLPQGIPIAVGALDAHVGAIGAGIGNGKFVKIIGTSTCDIMVFPLENRPKDFNGVAGIVEESVLPGHIGIEAGQAAVGDLLNWWVQQVLKENVAYHSVLTEKATKLKAGESGLLALDWNNGNRNVLGDQQLSGLVVGQTLATADYEIYRALIEATAFGALKIIRRVEDEGIDIEEIIVTGGIGHKNEMFMQIYADVIGYPVRLVENPETVAVGAAIMGVSAYKKDAGEPVPINELIDQLSVPSDRVYMPNTSEYRIYSRLYKIYSQLHMEFGEKSNRRGTLFNVMKDLMEIRNEVSNH